MVRVVRKCRPDLQFGFVVICAAGLVLAACGGDSDGGSSSGGNTEQSTAATDKGSAAADKYCGDIQTWIQKAKANPNTSAYPGLATDYNKLIDEGDRLSAAGGNKAQRAAQCRQQAASVMMSILNQAAGGGTIPFTIPSR
jgi:hypothetical protein